MGERAQFLLVAACEAGVGQRVTANAADFGGSQVSHHSCRSAQQQHALGPRISARHHCASAGDGVARDNRAIEDDCTHADQAVFPDGAPMDDGVVSHRDAVADLYWIARQAVQHGEVLNVGPRADFDRV